MKFVRYVLTGHGFSRVAFIFSCSVAFGACIVTPGKPPKDKFVQSPSVPQFHVLLEGKVVAAAFLTISDYRPSKTPPRMFSADENGNLLAPALATGKYRVNAFDVSGNSASLLINVTRESHAEGSTFELTLRQTGLPWRGTEAGTIRRLAGLVTDPTGSVIPNATVSVLPQQHSAQASALQLATDSQGGFAADVPEGHYVAFIISPGFASRMIRFRVSTGGAGSLLVHMDVGASC